MNSKLFFIENSELPPQTKVDEIDLIKFSDFIVSTNQNIDGAENTLQIQFEINDYESELSKEFKKICTSLLKPYSSVNFNNRRLNIMRITSERTNIKFTVYIQFEVQDKGLI